MKRILYLYAKIYKTLIKEIKDLNRYTTFMDQKIRHSKDANSRELIYRQCNSNKNLGFFLVDTDKLILKFI